jgi:hypothetical protein
MNWNQEELEQWALTRQQKEEDNQAIERYRAQDDSKIKELNIAVERINKTLFIRKAELDKEVTDTQAAQVQLDKAADDFARLHKVSVLVQALPVEYTMGMFDCASHERWQHPAVTLPVCPCQLVAHTCAACSWRCGALKHNVLAGAARSHAAVG